MIRVRLVQEIIPHYRIPVFENLAARPEIDLTIHADLSEGAGSLKGESHVPGCRLEHFSERTLGPLLWDSQIVSIAAQPSDVLILPWRTRSLFSSKAIRTARRSGAGVVLWGHGLSKYDNAFRRVLRTRFLKKVDALLFYDPVTAKKFVSDDLPAENLFAASNAIDQRPIQQAIKAWEDEPGKLEAFQKKEGLDPDHTTIFISRIEPDKKLDLLLDGLKYALERDPRMRLVVVGDGSARAEAEAHARAIEVDHAVRFLGAIYDETELAGWCLSACCMTYPVAVGLSVMHAFGYGLPVLTSDDISGHNPEINAIRPGENGLFYKDGDPGDLGRTLVEFAESDERRKQLSEAARASVGPDGWCIDRMVDGFVECITAVNARRTS